MWGDSQAKLDYAALACKHYSTDPKKELSSKRWKWKFKTWTNFFHVSLFKLDCSWKKKNLWKFVHYFYCNLSTAWPNFEQLKWKANKFGQESSHKSTIFGRENNIEFDVNPWTVSALKSRYFWWNRDSIKTWC